MAAFLELVVSVIAMSLRPSRDGTREGMGTGTDWRRGGTREEFGRLAETRKE
jgi:hypothetical protein